MPAKKSSGSASPVRSITTEFVANVKSQFSDKPMYRVLQNAITQTTVDNIALNRDVINAVDHTFSHHLDEWGATNQKGSGRCWIFAGLNLIRVGAMKKLKISNFEFSQNYVMFWDKFEKCNYFLEAIIETAGRDIDDRTVNCLLSGPINDGGQWNMFVNIVKKYGLVPKIAMPETESSSSTGAMNRAIINKVRHAAKQLRDMFAAGAKPSELQGAKREALVTLYRILALHLGNPPDKFDWQWRDSKKKLRREFGMTPRRFAQKYITVPLDEYVCLVHDPRKTSPLGRTFTVEYLGNVVGGTEVKYLNVPIEVIKQITLKTIKGGEPVWFGCDCGKGFRGDAGVWHGEVYDYDSIYDTRFDMDKASRLEYRSTAMNHAMLFTGVDVHKGQTLKWRVENSWGDGVANKGFYLMDDRWFDEHMFEIAARKSSLPEKYRKACAKKPIVLPAWDPMGSLA